MAPTARHACRDRRDAQPRPIERNELDSWSAISGRVKNDGTVAVDETKLDDMAEFEEVDATHTWIMNSAQCGNWSSTTSVTVTSVLQRSSDVRTLASS